MKFKSEVGVSFDRNPCKSAQIGINALYFKIGRVELKKAVEETLYGVG